MNKKMKARARQGFGFSGFRTIIVKTVSDSKYPDAKPENICQKGKQAEQCSLKGSGL